VRLVHHPATGDNTSVLATEIEVADSLWSQTRGLMFRRSIPEEYALVFEFGTARPRDLHMLFVPFPIDAIWTNSDVVQRVERLHPWRGIARDRGDRIVELPAGAATAVEAGDRVVLTDDER